MDEFGRGKSVRKLHENLGKVLFNETYFEESNNNKKPLIWSEHKIITKFGPKKIIEFGLGKVYKNCPKIKKKCYFTKLTSKSVISIGNLLFRPKIG